MAEGVLEAVPALHRDLVGPRPLGTGPLSNGGSIHLPDGVQIGLVAQDHDGELWGVIGARVCSVRVGEDVDISGECNMYDIPPPTLMSHACDQIQPGFPLLYLIPIFFLLLKKFQHFTLKLRSKQCSSSYTSLFIAWGGGEGGGGGSSKMTAKVPGVFLFVHVHVRATGY